MELCAGIEQAVCYLLNWPVRFRGRDKLPEAHELTEHWAGWLGGVWQAEIGVPCGDKKTPHKSCAVFFDCN